MAINKVVYRDETLVDLSEDTVTEDTLLEGETAHNAAGEKIVGRAKAGSDLETVANFLYPVGSIYFSSQNTNPKNLFGIGEWIEWGAGRVPVGVNTDDPDFNEVEKTGGVKDFSGTPHATIGATTLSASQIPSHTHPVSITTSSDGRHRHYIKRKNNVTASGSASASGPLSFASNASENNIDTDYVDAHTHSVSGNTSGNTGGGGSHTHTFEGTPTIYSTLQPYITCYMWKRIA